MTTIVSMLRGVNVGGHNKIKMDTLRALYGSLGLRDVQTYVQSGNVVFRTGERNLDQLARRIEKAIEKKVGFRPEVVLRSSSELGGVIARNPFAGRSDIEPGKLLVTFFGSTPDPEAKDKVHRIPTAGEEVRIDGRELYIYFPNGMGRSKLSLALIERTLKTIGTGRNWNTVRKLFELAEKSGSSK